ncbi:RNA polymerase recycling motor HelD [Paenibacillus alvei]|uniref:RNA polymerase recycling motor HelD n=1 Tax=Paenibacillus alvei TaxID=44250 RepID=UPI002282C039|nr:RNA polymerase recycling motor HelD [Paenibacillus alvei]MCY7485601.1 AAA family ATPase [Paenibacillus alvei]
MSTKEEQWRLEEERAVQVMEAIEQHIEPLQQDIGTIKHEVVEFRKTFWDDVKINMDDVNEAIETFASMKQQAEVLTEREHRHRHAARQLEVLTRMSKSPYFARIDFKETGESRSEQIYLGIGSFRNSEGEFLVYDWRAPVSSLYYDYPPGPAHYSTPVGEIDGMMELKRQFLISEGRFRGMFDTGVTIGDELLRQMLSQPSAEHMKSIVATIQQEQNRIIRNERSGILIVTGPAGSGKTSTALQRIAYLLYRYRDTLQAEQIVLFSPNPLFNRYVSTVLPELGERNMQQTTFQDYLEHRLSNSFKLEHPFEQMEYSLTAAGDPGYSARMVSIRFKAGRGYVEMIHAYVKWLGTEGLQFHDIRFRDAVLITSEQICDQLYRYDASLPLPNRLRLLAEWLRGELHRAAKEERSKPWVDEEVEMLDDDAYHEAYTQLQRKKKFSEETFDDFQRERNWLAAAIVNEQFKSLYAMVKKLEFIDMAGTYRQLFAEREVSQRCAPAGILPAEWNEICDATEARLRSGEMPFEDATPYLYLNECIKGFRVNTSIRQLFIDEAQDYSPFQFALLRRMFPRCGITLLGDWEQAIYPHTGEGDMNSSWRASDIGGSSPTETFHLTRSYRTTRPIMEFARYLALDGQHIEPFDRAGSKPTVTVAKDGAARNRMTADRVRQLLQNGHRNVAVICKTAQESREAYEALRNELPIYLVEQDTVSFEEGALVIPSYLAKGVEFDAVVIYDASEAVYGRANEQKLLYVACTRAMHELHVYSVGQPSPWIAEVPQETYIFQKG